METQATPFACLEVLAGPAAGQRLPLDAEMEFGRAQRGAGALSGDPWLSHAHAAVRRGELGFFEVEDLGSMEGTMVNGSPVRAPHKLHVGDVIELGSSRMRVTEMGAATAPAAEPESVKPGYTPASDSRRVLAWLADFVIEIGVAYVALRVFAGVVNVRGTNDIYAAVGFLLAAELTYRFLLESLFGQTLGKLLFGIRVVRVNGKPLDPNAVLIRTLLVAVDLWFLVGLIVMVISGRRRRRRIGDLAAGTIVVRSNVAHPGFARRERDRLMLASPLLWIATIGVVLHLIGHGLEPCRTAGMYPPIANEGSCIDVIDGISSEVTVVNAGHKLSLPGADVTLDQTAVKPGPGGSSIVGFKLTVTNTSAQALPLDSAGGMTELWVSSDVLGTAHLREVESGAFGTFHHKRTVAYAGGAATGWVTFAVPSTALSALTQPTSDLVFGTADGGTLHLGEIRLWRVAGSAGQRTIAGLTR